MHSVTCTSQVLDFCVDAQCEMHFQYRLAGILQPVVPPARWEGLRAPAVLQHLFLRDLAIDDIHQAGVPWLDHRQGGCDPRVLIVELDRLMPVRVCLDMEMKSRGFNLHVGAAVYDSRAAQPTGQGRPRIHLCILP